VQCAHDNQEDFTWVVMWAKRDLRERSSLINMGNVELFNQMNREQPTNYHAIMKFINSLNPNNTINISQ